MIHAPFPLYKRSTKASRYISDHKNRGQKEPGKQQSDEVPCLDTPVLAQWGPGGTAIADHMHP